MCPFSISLCGDAFGIPIYNMWELDKFSFSKDVRLRRGVFACFDPDEHYFVITETGAPSSFCDLSDPRSPFDADKLIEVIYERKRSYGFEEIQALLGQ